ncbi:hypothetical protein WJX81_004912 [Elliptochloris bilobata]|uniref:Rieske domain-containing protein n=1 Tax=Elliptochloris bilobata TaxID=381761 RepID=A0AAW1RTT4_9CHLO
MCLRPAGRVLTLPVPLSGVRALPRRCTPRAALPAEKGGLEVQGLQAKAVQVDEDPSPFFEPLLRSFLLGLGAGAIFESLHVCMKLFGLVGDVGFRQLADTLPTVVDRFSPLFVGDHVVAVGSWILFYVIEAAAVITVLKTHPDAGDAATEIKNMVTLPKKMLPLRLALFKQLLLLGSKGLQPAAAVAAPEAPPHVGSVGNVLSFPRSRVEPRSATVVAPPKPEAPAEAPEAAPPAPQPERIGARPPAGPSALVDQRVKRGLKPGQLDPETADFAHRMRELTGRRSYLLNFWYAAGISEKVGTKPLGVEVLGQKLVLFRGRDGVVHCLHDICPHRGAPLHLGWVAEVGGHDCVVCPYHGWAFDTEGVLRDVPAAEHGSDFPQKPLIDAFPVEERGGFVWLFYGSQQLPEDERPPIPLVPELEDPAWKPVYGEIEFECNHWSVFENAIDMAHIHYLHNDTFGNQGQPQIRGMTCTSNAYGVTADFRLHNKAVKGWEFSKVPEVHVTAKALLPSTSVIAFTLGNGLSFTTFVNTVPINEHRTVNRFALIRRLDVDAIGARVFNMDAWDRIARQAMIRILSEDKAMVEELRPDMLQREISVKADLPQMAFRKLRQEYVDMGYGVLPEAAAQRFRGADQ